MSGERRGVSATCLIVAPTRRAHAATLAVSYSSRPMPVYTCPECETKLKRGEPLPAGKKLRCPECGNVFAPPAAAKAPTPAAKPAAPEPPAIEGEKEIFAFQKTEFDPDLDAARLDVFTPIKDRFERSMRGPALIQVVRPSDWLLRTGAAICRSFSITLGMISSKSRSFSRKRRAKRSSRSPGRSGGSRS